MNLHFDKPTKKLILGIVIPVALQFFINNLLPMMDTIMLGFLGEKQMAAVTLSNTPFFVIMLIIAGFQSGNNVLSAQYWGKRDLRTMNKIFGMTSAGCLAIALVTSLLIFLFPVQIFSMISNDPDVIHFAAEYARWAAFSYVFSALSQSYLSSLRCTENAKFGLKVQTFSVVLDIVLNYLFIFGIGGVFPGMGVAGAAFSTLISRAIEFGIIAYYALKIETVFVLDFSALKRFDKLLFKDYISSSVPIVVNEFLWGLGTSLITVVYSLMGSDVLAANTVALNFERFALVISFGFASAASVIVGKHIGVGEEETGYRVGKQLGILSALIGVGLGIILAVLGPVLLPFFDIAPQTRQLALYFVFIYAAATPLKSYNVVNLVGSLRAGGDGAFVLFLDVFFLWVLVVPLGFLLGTWLHLSAVLVCMLQPVEELIKCVVSTLRYNSRRWIRNLTRENLLD